MDQVPDDADELAFALASLQAQAPPGWEVVDLWRCTTCCDDIHAIVLPPEGPPPSRAERRGAARARRRGASRG